MEGRKHPLPNERFIARQFRSLLVTFRIFGPDEVEFGETAFRLPPDDLPREKLQGLTSPKRQTEDEEFGLVAQIFRDGSGLDVRTDREDVNRVATGNGTQLISLRRCS